MLNQPCAVFAEMGALGGLLIGAIGLIAATICGAVVIMRYGGRPPGWR